MQESERTRSTCQSQAAGAQCSAPSRITLRYMGGLSVGADYHQQHSAKLQAALLAEGRLALVLDLDHTLLHSKIRAQLSEEVRLASCCPCARTWFTMLLKAFVLHQPC